MQKEEILKKLQSGELKLHEIENFVSHSDAISIRREFLEQKTGLNLSSISPLSFDPQSVFNRNAENVIGQIGLPVGVAGPLKIQDKGTFFIPMATTEGALIASTSRGIKALNSSGIKTYSTYHGITRAPVYKLKSIEDGFKFQEFIKSSFEELKNIASSTSSHITLIDFKVYINGRSMWIKFFFDTQDAMGMNMAVKATQAISDFLQSKFEARLIALSGNVCIDKKPANINNFDGRGRTVYAESFISSETLQSVLKCSPADLVEVNNRKVWQGSQLAGSLGFNSHVANIVAAVFLATGQDIAHVVDASTAVTTFELDENGIYATLKIPSLNLGTVGGGTHLSNQKEMIDLILTDIESGKGVENRTDTLAHIICATALAAELSLNAALASNTLAKSHEQLGRGKN